MIRRIRFYVQLLAFALGVFILWGKLPEVVGYYTALHIFPFLSKLANFELPVYWAITLVVLFSAVFVGRWYCSFICPVGFIQDLLATVATKICRIQTRATPNLNMLRWLILGVILAVTFARTPWYGVLDHYANFSRLIALSLHFSVIGLSVSVVFLLLVGLAVVFPRFFCNVLCPSGAILSLCAWQPRLRPKVSEVCSSCGSCEARCPARCITRGQIAPSQCIDCFECLEICPQGAYSLSQGARQKESSLHEKRSFVRSVGVIALGLGGVLVLKPKVSQALNYPLVLPPGAKCLEHYLKRCTGCGACVSVCPSKVLEASPRGVLPVAGMNYLRSYCAYECNACLAVCPTGALTFHSVSQKKAIKLGSAHIYRRRCIPYVKQRECLACAEHCPTGAIELLPWKGVKAPVVRDNYCVGCGACEYVCPVRPRRAIFVQPAQVHSVAYDPRKGQGSEKPREVTSRDFPF